MLKLYKFEEDFGRMGYLKGLFVSSEKEVKALMGKTIYFGEVLGKHSEIETEINIMNTYALNVPEDVCRLLVEAMGGNETIAGYNPFDYLEE